MYQNTYKVRTISFKDRASSRLTALFGLTFLAFFIGWMVYDLFNSMLEKQRIEATMPNQPAVVEIDPKIETDLTKVLASEYLPETAVVSDPFNDKSGISGLTKTNNSVSTPAATNNTPQTAGVNTQTQNNPQRQTVAGTTTGRTYGNFPDVVPQEDTKTRLTTWEQSGRFMSKGEPEPQIFSIDDLIPVGVVSGGDEKQEVMFYSQAADRTLSFPVGTRFYDAWLMEVRSDGVVFTYDDAYRTSRLKSWGRSVKSNNSGD